MLAIILSKLFILSISVRAVVNPNCMPADYPVFFGGENSKIEIQVADITLLEETYWSPQNRIAIAGFETTFEEGSGTETGKSGFIALWKELPKYDPAQESELSDAQGKEVQWVKKFTNIEKFEALKIFKKATSKEDRPEPEAKIVVVMRLSKSASDAMILQHEQSGDLQKPNSYDAALNHGLLQVITLSLSTGEIIHKSILSNYQAFEVSHLSQGNSMSFQVDLPHMDLLIRPIDDPTIFAKIKAGTLGQSSEVALQLNYGGVPFVKGGKHQNFGAGVDYGQTDSESDFTTNFYATQCLTRFDASPWRSAPHGKGGMNVVDFVSAVTYNYDSEPAVGTAYGSIYTKLYAGMEFGADCTYQVTIRSDVEMASRGLAFHYLIRYDIPQWENLIYSNTIVNFIGTDWKTDMKGSVTIFTAWQLYRQQTESGRQTTELFFATIWADSGLKPVVNGGAADQNSFASSDKVFKIGALLGKWQFVATQPAIADGSPTVNPSGISYSVYQVNWIILDVDKSNKYFLTFYVYLHHYKNGYDDYTRMTKIPEFSSQKFVVAAMLNNIWRYYKDVKVQHEIESNLGLVIIGNFGSDENKFLDVEFQNSSYGLNSIKRNHQMGFIYKQFFNNTAAPELNPDFFKSINSNDLSMYYNQKTAGEYYVPQNLNDCLPCIMMDCGLHEQWNAEKLCWITQNPDATGSASQLMLPGHTIIGTAVMSYRTGINNGYQIWNQNVIETKTGSASQYLIQGAVNELSVIQKIEIQRYHPANIQFLMPPLNNSLIVRNEVIQITLLKNQNIDKCWDFRSAIKLFSKLNSTIFVYKEGTQLPLMISDSQSLTTEFITIDYTTDEQIVLKFETFKITNLENQNVFQNAKLQFKIEKDSYFDQEIIYNLTVCPELLPDLSAGIQEFSRTSDSIEDIKVQTKVFEAYQKLCKISKFELIDQQEQNLFQLDQEKLILKPLEQIYVKGKTNVDFVGQHNFILRAFDNFINETRTSDQNIQITITHACASKAKISFIEPVLELKKYYPKEAPTKLYDLPFKANSGPQSLFKTDFNSEPCGDVAHFEILSVVPLTNYSSYIENYPSFLSIFKITQDKHLQISTRDPKLGGFYTIKIQVKLKDYSPVLDLPVPDATFNVKVEIYDPCMYTYMSSKWHLSLNHTIEQRILQQTQTVNYNEFDLKDLESDECGEIKYSNATLIILDGPKSKTIMELPSDPSKREFNLTLNNSIQEVVMQEFQTYERMFLNHQKFIIVNFTGDLTYQHNFYPKFEVQILVNI